MSIASTTRVSIIDPTTSAEPCREQRDEDGRRIAVTFESGRVQPAAPARNCWLVALDGSGRSLHALARAMRLAFDSGACGLDLVNVQPWLSKEAAEAGLAQRGREACVEACAMLDANGLGWRLHVLMGEPAARIVEQAERLDSLGIVIGARGLTATKALLLGSVAQHVIHTARRAVLVVRAAETSNQQESTPC